MSLCPSSPHCSRAAPVLLRFVPCFAHRRRIGAQAGASYAVGLWLRDSPASVATLGVRATSLVPDGTAGLFRKKSHVEEGERACSESTRKA